MGTIVRQALLIAAKDTRVFFKDRFAVVFAFLFPLMFVLGFSLALSNVVADDERLRLTVTTREETGISHQIIAALAQSPDISVQARPYFEALDAVEQGRLDGYVAFPGDFTANLLAGRPTQLEVVADAEAPNTRAALEGLARGLAGRISNTQTTLRAIAELTGGVPNVDLSTSSREALSTSSREALSTSSRGALSTSSRGALSTLAQAQVLIGFQTEQVGEIRPLKASNFTLPGYLTMFVFFAAAMSAEAVARERQTQTLERMMSNGVRRQSVILGKYLSTAYRGLMQLAVLWIVGIFAFRIDLGVAPAAVILVSVLMVLASAGFGVMLASFVKTVRSADSVGVLTSLVLAPIGGCWWPLFIAPAWMQTLARLTPHGWANTAFNKLMLFGAEFGDVALEMAALIVFGIAFMAVALWRFKLSTPPDRAVP
jgi:ABC-2 type transport system permease protein